MKVGNGLEEGVAQGPLIDMKAVEKVEEHVHDAVAKGARVLTGGKRHAKGGSFYEPTVLADVKTNMKITHEETFGPVAPLFRFKDEAEVIRMANDSEYGLGGAVWTKDINRAFRVARAIETGRMWVNNYNTLPAHAPFGGYKKSGIGRETHKMMLEHYTQKKNIFISLSEDKVGFY